MKDTVNFPCIPLIINQVSFSFGLSYEAIQCKWFTPRLCPTSLKLALEGSQVGSSAWVCIHSTYAFIFHQQHMFSLLCVILTFLFLWGFPIFRYFSLSRKPLLQILRKNPTLQAAPSKPLHIFKATAQVLMAAMNGGGIQFYMQKTIVVPKVLLL